MRLINASDILANEQKYACPCSYTSDVSVTKFYDNITSFERCADYLMYIRSKQGVECLDFTYQPEVIEVVENGDTASVHIYTLISYKYTPDSETTLEGDNYTVWFTKVNNQWCIVDVDSEANTASGLDKAVANYDVMIDEFDVWLRNNRLEKEAAAQTASIADEYESDKALLSASATGPYDRTYNKGNAIAYAFTYTVSTYTASTGNDTAYMNPLFPNLTNYGGNCQNFVSQCLWAGFGGSNSSAAINARKFPMDATGGYEYNWANGLDGAWKATTPMRNYYTNSNKSTETTGMITNYNGKGSNEYTGSFSNYSGNAASMKGAALYVNKDADGDYGHVLLISEAKGKTFDEVYFSGNSPMRKYKKLSTEYSGTMCMMIPIAMKDGRGCTHNFTSSSGISLNYCRLCHYNRLKVTGNLQKPIAQNTTTNVGGSANMKCFRMALCITTPNGVSTWTERLNTAAIGVDYTFREKGIYTIQAVARDQNPDAYSTDYSVTAEQTFTIRVY